MKDFEGPLDRRLLRAMTLQSRFIYVALTLQGACHSLNNSSSFSLVCNSLLSRVDIFPFLLLIVEAISTLD